MTLTFQGSALLHGSTGRFAVLPGLAGLVWVCFECFSYFLGPVGAITCPEHHLLTARVEVQKDPGGGQAHRSFHPAPLTI